MHMFNNPFGSGHMSDFYERMWMQSPQQFNAFAAQAGISIPRIDHLESAERPKERKVSKPKLLLLTRKP